jgi:hypothetical protein
MIRWRLVLGEGTEDTLGGLSEKWGQCERALGFMAASTDRVATYAPGGAAGGAGKTRVVRDRRAAPATWAASANPT